jgi:Na+-transporting methylmalonyl-CoA/oxaloacetate decarboxylase gamma subunit
VREDGKAVLVAVSDLVGLTFVLLCLFLVVMTVKPLSSVTSSRLGGSEEALAVHLDSQL